MYFCPYNIYSILLKINNMKKILTLLLLAVFTLVLSTSCGSDKAKTPAKENTTAKAKAAKAKPKAKNNAKPGDYYVSLQKALKLKNKQVRSLRAIEAKYTQKLRQIRKAEGKVTQAQRKTFTTQKNEEIKTLLGPALYKKKVAYDKRQRKNKKQ